MRTGRSLNTVIEDALREALARQRGAATSALSVHLNTQYDLYYVHNCH